MTIEALFAYEGTTSLWTCVVTTLTSSGGPWDGEALRAAPWLAPTGAPLYLALQSENNNPVITSL